MIKKILSIILSILFISSNSLANVSYSGVNMGGFDFINTPGIVTGTYIGTGIALTQSISLPFEPEFVAVCATSEYIWWKNDTSWHGRSQRLSAQNSAYIIGNLDGQIYEIMNGKGFTVTSSGNTVGKTYYYIAIRDNDSGTMETTSWIGNATDNRVLSWTNRTPNIVFVKRDSARASVWRWTGASASLLAGYQEGTNQYIKSLNSVGITLSADIYVNENNNVALGEGIEGLAFFDNDYIDVIPYTGNGASDRTITTSFTPTAVFILDAVNDVSGNTRKCGFVTKEMGSNVKYFDDSAVESGIVTGMVTNGFQLDEGYNVSGRSYVLFALKESISSSKHQTVIVRNSGGVEFAENTGHIDLANTPALSGDCTIEWFGRTDYGADAGEQFLIMLGQGGAGTQATSAGEYNGGIFLSSVDPDSNGWQGKVIRVVHSDYFSRSRTENSINYYNLNTGVIVNDGDIIHIVAKHDGNGHWKVYKNGKKIKDYNVNLDQATYGNRTNGGTGNAKPGVLNGWIEDDGTFTTTTALISPGEVYLVRIWDSEISDDDAKKLWESARDDLPWTGLSADKEYDFRTNGSATDATGTNTSIISRTAVDEQDL